MRTVDVTLTKTTTQAAMQRIRFRMRMCDAQVLEETDVKLVLSVGDTELDLLVDTLLTTPGVRLVRTRPLV